MMIIKMIMERPMTTMTMATKMTMRKMMKILLTIIMTFK